MDVGSFDFASANLVNNDDNLFKSTSVNVDDFLVQSNEIEHEGEVTESISHFNEQEEFNVFTERGTPNPMFDVEDMVFKDEVVNEIDNVVSASIEREPIINGIHTASVDSEEAVLLPSGEKVDILTSQVDTFNIQEQKKGKSAFKNWEEEHSLKLEKKRQNEELLIENLKQKGREEYVEWNKERQEKIKVAERVLNENSPRALRGSEFSSKHSWNAVVSLLKACHSEDFSKDITRMMSIINSLKDENSS